MPLPIKTHEERIKEERGISGCIFGKSGIGKTSLLRTLPAEETLFIDLEGGDLSVMDWKGDTLRPTNWESCRKLILFLSGASGSTNPLDSYGLEEYVKVCQTFGDRKVLDKYKIIFIDSITAASRLCFNYAKDNSLIYRDKSVVGVNGIQAYGMLADEMIQWTLQLTNSKSRSVWFTGILDEKNVGKDDNKRTVYEPQVDGQRLLATLPGLVDEVLTLTDQSGNRRFVCQTVNDKNYPAKDRSGKLSLYEDADLGKLINKLKGIK